MRTQSMSAREAYRTIERGLVHRHCSLMKPRMIVYGLRGRDTPNGNAAAYSARFIWRSAEDIGYRNVRIDDCLTFRPPSAVSSTSPIAPVVPLQFWHEQLPTCDAAHVWPVVGKHHSDSKGSQSLDRDV